MENIIKQGNLSEEEFEERCCKVFLPNERENFYFIQIGQSGRIYIQMSELDEDGEKDYFIYEPNMDERPHALAYLMGERDDFDD